MEAPGPIESIANDPVDHVAMKFEPGHVALLATAKNLHSREASEDAPDPEHRRHPLRLWLTAHDFASMDQVLRGGPSNRS